MSIIKNEPIFEFKDGDYCKPHHIIVDGSYEEIGFDLATIAKNDYGCKLGIYDYPIFAQGRKAYMDLHWPEMAARSKGVRKAYGLSENDVVYDATSLPYDWLDPQRDNTQADLTTCSATILPTEKTENGGVFVSRNWDMMALVMWTEILGKTPPGGAYRIGERYMVTEIRPDNGYKSIYLGGMEALHPFLDGINEKGLYVTMFHDPQSIGHEAGGASGLNFAGIPISQSVALLLDTCTTVEEAKLKILSNRLCQAIFRCHLLIADASGNATVFEINGNGEYVFVNREANEPLFVTNHAIGEYPEPSAYPEFDRHAEHNTFARQLILRDCYAGLKAPFKEEDATAMMESVHCSFTDTKKAESGPMERTLSNATSDLKNKTISVRWYLGDVAPIDGTNHMQDRMTEFYTFGFQE